MGRSPGKWIKAVLFRKKGSKSSLSKGKEISKSSTEGGSIFSKKDKKSNLDVVPFSISEPVLISGGKENPGSEKGTAAGLPSVGLILASPKQDVDAETATDHDLPESSEKMRLEKAATKAQAAFRGYLARKEFRSQEDIIHLQAFIRGHFVRRQAVATLYCVQGIVKFQALVRGQNVRRSDIGMEVRKRSTLVQKDSKLFESGQTSTFDRREKFLDNAFVAKLLSLSPTMMPVLLQYGLEEPNSAPYWLLRWTSSRIWEPKSKPKGLPTKQRKVGTGKAKAKRSGGRLHSGTVENGSNHNISDYEKQKRMPRRISNHSAHSVQGHPQNEIEKTKSNLKKFSNPTRDISSERELDPEKQCQNDSKQLKLPSPDLSGHSIDTQSDKLQVDLESDVFKTTGQETHVELPVTETCDHSTSISGKHPKMISEENEDILTDKDFKDDLTSDENHKVSKRRASLPAKPNYQVAGLPSVTIANDDSTSNENHKASKRRASLPAKHDEHDMGLPSETKVPSYMATTESAKAKVRGQVSPRFGQDTYEKDGVTRRHSLPSSNNAKLTSSPRVQSLVEATSGKGGIKIDRSLSSSRDGKGIQAEWRR